MSRYKIWDKESNVITPIGEVLTPAQWIERYPVANVLPTVCGGGAINGAYFGVYDDMVNLYTKNGCDFSECATAQEYLDKIEEFEDALNAPSDEVSTEERTAAALEAMVMLNMEDETISAQKGVKYMNYNIVKKNYDKGLWTKQLVAIAVRKGIITKDQYAEITGETLQIRVSFFMFHIMKVVNIYEFI